MTEAGGDGDRYSRLVRDLCAVLLTVISPPPQPSSQQRRPRRATPPTTTQKQAAGMSPAAVASMLLGASMALMLCGSVTFAIGLLLMPWVAGVTLLLGFAGAVSALSSGLFGNHAGLPLPDKLAAARRC